MLKKPGAHHVGGHLRKDATLSLTFLARLVVEVVIARLFVGADTVVKNVTCIKCVYIISNVQLKAHINLKFQPSIHSQSSTYQLRLSCRVVDLSWGIEEWRASLTSSCSTAAVEAAAAAAKEPSPWHRVSYCERPTCSPSRPSRRSMCEPARCLC